MTENMHIWMRAETKPNERRAPITPIHAHSLINQYGFKITVEKSLLRCFSDSQYAAVGCELVEAGTWNTAPSSTYILGLKELPQSDEPISHTHIYFAHCFKNQHGWQNLIKRYKKGNGKILDLEFLVDERGQRVATFGRPAGIAGAIVGIMAWCKQKQTGMNADIKNLGYYHNENIAISELKNILENIKTKPRALVIGANGRVGKGSVYILEKLGIETTQWIKKETSDRDSYPEIMEHDILINCINLTEKITPFVTMEDLQSNDKRSLTICVDISCDYTNPYNPLPIYNHASTFDDVVIPIVNKYPFFDLISIDHLPSLLPLESSTNYAEQLFPVICQLKSFTDVWQRAHAVYNDRTKLV